MVEKKESSINLPKRLLIATGNQGKFKEFLDLFKDFNLDLVSTKNFNLAEPEEVGKSFIENAEIKARYYSDKTRLPALADDSGLCINDLNGRPGIHSARFANDPTTGKSNFQMAFSKIFEELAITNKGGAQRLIKAQFVCALSFFNPEYDLMASFQGVVRGRISLTPKGNNGFGYDPIFIKDGMQETFGEIDQKLKDSISHRKKAFEKLLAATK